MRAQVDAMRHSEAFVRCTYGIGMRLCCTRERREITGWYERKCEHSGRTRSFLIMSISSYLYA